MIVVIWLGQAGNNHVRITNRLDLWHFYDGADAIGNCAKKLDGNKRMSGRWHITIAPFVVCIAGAGRRRVGGGAREEEIKVD